MQEYRILVMTKKELKFWKSAYLTILSRGSMSGLEDIAIVADKVVEQCMKRKVKYEFLERIRIVAGTELDKYRKALEQHVADVEFYL